MNTRQVGVQEQVPHTVEEVTPVHAIGREGMRRYADLECLRERVPKRSPAVLAGKRVGIADDGKREEGEEEQELWAPALAVFRAVDAVLSGGGRSRISFVHRGAACEIDKM